MKPVHWHVCGKVWGSSNALLVASRHNQTTGHAVTVEIGYVHVFRGAATSKKGGK